MSTELAYYVAIAVDEDQKVFLAVVRFLGICWIGLRTSKLCLCASGLVLVGGGLCLVLLKFGFMAGGCFFVLRKSAFLDGNMALVAAD